MIASPINRLALAALAAPCLCLVGNLSAQVVITPEPGYLIAWDGNDGDFFNSASPAPVPDNLALASNGATPIASSELGLGTHFVGNLNDGLYGNSNSWISANVADGDPGPPNTFAGVTLPAMAELTSFAFGRDNGNGGFDDNPPGTDACGGQCDDRSLGIYTLQITTDGTNWTTIGILDYQGSVDMDTAPGGDFTSYLRHRYDISTDTGDPVSALGVRLLVPVAGIGGGTAIDEIELFETPPPLPSLVPVESGGAADTALNLAAAGTAFAKDTLAGRAVGSLNDGVYGDASAWVGATPESFAGIALAAQSPVASLAFGRDNTGALTDRTLGTYTLQFTTVGNPGAATPDADWQSFATVTLAAESPDDPSLRHRFNFPSKTASGIRVLTPDGAAIDELEIYANPYTSPPLQITPADGFAMTWDGNDGDFFDPAAPPAGAIVPDNLALASNGATPFASSEFGLPHFIVNLNDGFFGNSNSWISNGGDPAPQAFAGIAFTGPTAIERIAWGRDNGNNETDDCGGQCADRSLGTYTLQITSVPSPDAATPDEDWTTVATIFYSQGDDVVVGELFTEYLRHEFAVSAGGAPLLATGIRILVPGAGDTAIDEIEVYGATTPPHALEIASFARDAVTGEVTITFFSVPGGAYALDKSEDLALESWVEIDDAIVGATGSPTTTVTNSNVALEEAAYYYRIREF